MAGQETKADAAARRLGRRGGNARRDALTPQRRSEIARKAARARWDRAADVPDRMTEAEYLELPETLQPMELIDGDVVRSPSPTWGHQDALQRLVFDLTVWALEGGRRYRICQSPLDVRIAPNRILQPDAFVLDTPLDRMHQGPIDLLPLLVIEVVSQNRVYDRVTKRLVYAAAGVPEMWTVDLEDELVERWTGDGLDHREEVRERLSTPRLPGFVLEVPTLFRD